MKGMIILIDPFPLHLGHQEGDVLSRYMAYLKLLYGRHEWD